MSHTSQPVAHHENPVEAIGAQPPQDQLSFIGRIGVAYHSGVDRLAAGLAGAADKLSRNRRRIGGALMTSLVLAGGGEALAQDDITSTQIYEEAMQDQQQAKAENPADWKLIGPSTSDLKQSIRNAAYNSRFDPMEKIKIIRKGKKLRVTTLHNNSQANFDIANLHDPKDYNSYHNKLYDLAADGDYFATRRTIYEVVKRQHPGRGKFIRWSTSSPERRPATISQTNAFRWYDTAKSDSISKDSPNQYKGTGTVEPYELTKALVKSKRFYIKKTDISVYTNSAFGPLLPKKHVEYYRIKPSINKLGTTYVYGGTYAPSDIV